MTDTALAAAPDLLEDPAKASFDEVGITVANPDTIRSWSKGEVKNPETIIFNLINYTPVVGNEFTVFNMTGGAGESGNFATVEVGGSYLTQDSGSYGIWSGSNAGVTYQFSDSTGKLTVQAVPEPSTYVLVALGVLALLVACRRAGTP